MDDEPMTRRVFITVEWSESVGTDESTARVVNDEIVDLMTRHARDGVITRSKVTTTSATIRRTANIGAGDGHP